MRDFETRMLIATDDQISKMLDVLYLPVHQGKEKDAQKINTTLLAALVAVPSTIAKKIFRHFSKASEKRCWEDMIRILDAKRQGTISNFDIEQAQLRVLRLLPGKNQFH